MSDQQTAANRPLGDETEVLKCMDIWGGTGAVDRTFDVSGLRVHVVSRPFEGDEQGGDIYYISMCGSGRIARVSIADVAGHGRSVGEVAMRLRSLMRKHINTPNQARFARALNEEFAAISNTEMFATAILATYWAPSDALILVNAGHPPPLLYRAREGRWDALTSDSPEVIATGGESIGLRNLPLGIIEPTGYDQFAVRLETDDLVLLYTDALIEAMDSSGQMLGTQGLQRCADAADGARPDGFARRLLEQIDVHTGGAAPDDDQTVVLLHHTATDPPPMSIGEFIRVLGRVMGVVGPSKAAAR